MAEYIEKEPVEKFFKDTRRNMNPEKHTRATEFYTRDNMLLNAEQYIHSIEPADVKTVVRGEWNISYEKFVPTFKCSQCGYHLMLIAGENATQIARNFCPNCGADMRDIKES